MGTAYSQLLTAGGGSPPYHNWVIASGALPPGLTLDGNAGTITGLPTSGAGSPYAFGVMVMDSVGGASAAQNFSIAINQPSGPTILNGAQLPAGTVGAAY